MIAERTIKRKRNTRTELAAVFSRVKKPHEYLSEIHDFYSKIILAQVYNNPKHGAKKLSGLLMLEGISLSPNYIYKLLVKRSLNRSSLRRFWKDNLENQKEMEL
ncbi:MAG: hypothetical protein PHN84_11175 [Desulfuromonadaceae bacterium]|nr:hypothetical protein [Desulfuromonadaceae bacterium]